MSLSYQYLSLEQQVVILREVLSRNKQGAAFQALIKLRIEALNIDPVDTSALSARTELLNRLDPSSWEAADIEQFLGSITEEVLAT